MNHECVIQGTAVWVEANAVEQRRKKKPHAAAGVRANMVCTFILAESTGAMFQLNGKANRWQQSQLVKELWDAPEEEVLHRFAAPTPDLSEDVCATMRS